MYRSTASFSVYGALLIRTATYSTLACNGAENSHQPSRERERRMRGLKADGHAQRFMARFGTISSFSKIGRHFLAAKNYRDRMSKRFNEWSEMVEAGPIS